MSKPRLVWNAAAAVAAAALALGTAAGCKKSSRATGAVVLRYLAAPDVGGSSKEIIRRFEALNPDIRVEMVEGPAASNTREDMYATAFMAGEGAYDMAYMDVVWMPKFAAQGWLRPLDDWFPPELRRDFLPGDIEGSQYQGKTYRVPIQADGGVLYYRKDLLDAKGLEPPKTWAGLVAVSKKLQSPPGLWGFVFQGKQYEGLVCDFLEMVWGHGGSMVDADGTVRIDERPAIEALRALVDAVRKDRISPESVLTYQEEETRHTFQEGGAVFMRNWPYAWNLMQQENSPVRGKIGILPMVRGPGGMNAAALGGWGFGISAASRHPEAAWRFIRFTAEPEQQKLAFLRGGIVPTRRALFQDPDVLRAAPHFKDIGRVLEGARPRPVRPDYARLSDMVQVHVSAALAGQEEPEAALRAAARELRAVLKR